MLVFLCSLKIFSKKYNKSVKKKSCSNWQIDIRKRFGLYSLCYITSKTNIPTCMSQWFNVFKAQYSAHFNAKHNSDSVQSREFENNTTVLLRICLWGTGMCVWMGRSEEVCISPVSIYFSFYFYCIGNLQGPVAAWELEQMIVLLEKKL